MVAEDAARAAGLVGAHDLAEQPARPRGRQATPRAWPSRRAGPAAAARRRQPWSSAAGRARRRRPPASNSPASSTQSRGGARPVGEVAGGRGGRSPSRLCPGSRSTLAKPFSSRGRPGDRRPRGRRRRAGRPPCPARSPVLVTRQVTSTARSPSSTRPLTATLQVGVVEGGVGQAVAERVADLAVERVVAAVADEDALAVADVPGLAGEVQVRRGVLEPQRDRLGQPAARVRRAEAAGRRPRRRRPGRTASTRGRAGVVLPVRQPHRRAVGEHHDERCGLACARSRQQRGLVGGRSMWARSKPSDSSPAAGRGRRPPRRRVPPARPPRRPAASSSPRRVDAEAGGERDLHAVGHRGAQLVEGDVDPGRVHLRAAGALVARRAGELADHRDGLAGGWAAAAAARRRSSAAPRTRAAASRASAWWASTSKACRRLRRAPWRARRAGAPGPRPGRGRPRRARPRARRRRSPRRSTPSLGGISRSSPAASAATRSCTAPQSETTSPSKPHSSRSTSVSSHGCCDA